MTKNHISEVIPLVQPAYSVPDFGRGCAKVLEASLAMASAGIIAWRGGFEARRAFYRLWFWWIPSDSANP